MGSKPKQEKEAAGSPSKAVAPGKSEKPSRPEKDPKKKEKGAAPVEKPVETPKAVEPAKEAGKESHKRKHVELSHLWEVRTACDNLNAVQLIGIIRKSKTDLIQESLKDLTETQLLFLLTECVYEFSRFHTGSTQILLWIKALLRTHQQLVATNSDFLAPLTIFKSALLAKADLNEGAKIMGQKLNTVLAANRPNRKDQVVAQPALVEYTVGDAKLLNQIDDEVLLSDLIEIDGESLELVA